MRSQFAPTLVVALLAVGLRCSSAVAQQFEHGKALYASRCTACHGAAGEGVADQRDQPLRGDLSVLELAETIRETMPEDAPGSLSVDDANAIAAYVHHEFYSPMAQMRNAPPHVELSHLTVEQYRRSVLDLMTPFTHRPTLWTETRGLKRTVHQGEWNKDRKQVDERVDAQLIFDWGDGNRSRRSITRSGKCVGMVRSLHRLPGYMSFTSTRACEPICSSTTVRFP